MDVYAHGPVSEVNPDGRSARPVAPRPRVLTGTRSRPGGDRRDARHLAGWPRTGPSMKLVRREERPRLAVSAAAAVADTGGGGRGGWGGGGDRGPGAAAAVAGGGTPSGDPDLIFAGGPDLSGRLLFMEAGLACGCNTNVPARRAGFAELAPLRDCSRPGLTKVPPWLHLPGFRQTASQHRDRVPGPGLPDVDPVSAWRPPSPRNPHPGWMPSIRSQCFLFPLPHDRGPPDPGGSLPFAIRGYRSRTARLNSIVPVGPRGTSMAH